MSLKSLIFVSLLVCSTIGGYLSVLWGADMFSFGSIIGSLIGGLAGIYIGYKIWDSYFN